MGKSKNGRSRGPDLDALMRQGSQGGTFIALSALGSPGVAPAPAPDPKAPPPCHLCTARCCKYFALEIDAPTTPREHDQVRWFLLHHGVVVWVQEGDWYLEIRVACRHLEPDNRCGIYETRPQICRDYGMPEAGGGPCEFFTDEATFDLYFDTAEKFQAWSEGQLARRALRLARRRQRYRERTIVEKDSQEALQ